MNFSRFHVLRIQETDYRPYFTCGGILYFLKYYKSTARCVNTVQTSANCVRALTKNQLTRHACVPSWPQRCSGNIRKRNLLFWITLVIPWVKFRFHCADFYETRHCVIQQILVRIACSELAKFLLGPSVKNALYCSLFKKLTIIDCIRWRPPLPNFIQIDFEICKLWGGIHSSAK
jgi:hypothetical protein